MKIHRMQGKNFVVGLFVAVVELLCFGCVRQTASIAPDDMCVCEPRRRECPTNDTPFVEMSWREFRPFCVFVPSDIEMECCCVEDGCRMMLTVPGMDILVKVCVLESNLNDIDLALVLRRLPWRNPLDWHMEKRYSDRRLLMCYDVSSSSEAKLYCYCEFDSGECLFFMIPYLEQGNADYVSAWLWRLCRSLKFEVKCRDAFNCMKAESPINQNVPAVAKIKWDRIAPDLGTFEWRSFRWFELFVPSDVKVDYCTISGNDFVFDLPGERHYVTIVIYGELDDFIADQDEFCSYSGDMLSGKLPPDEKEKVRLALGQRQRIGLDWYMNEEFPDRRLLVVHRNQREGCEGVACYCEYEDGVCVEFCIRGSGPISKDEIDYFLQICRTVRVREIDEGDLVVSDLKRYPNGAEW